ncbi:bifunctional 2-C-methyl-D-erythritol 4-phosphate cytidylyltransferase/2-C-methyl-D-erythritol 2,4-cyclodiphosphate synthase [Erythrobacter crassostreae]|uniref:Bifunctional enzyme IspD/IspF n=1 Tax=Erythrobacter crassostreae TaxID=2828328 RepID=A0A9X1F6C7_9SPHN|nr:bifunctional 2-C-methyl-D-erythritol 4-phosphate cytidylyltransferase/2-C-methyl-D-erythritol 2,4-cyclodiphosphate synthase [Erythrobacter crassostrea]MBV7260278.1 bifunctional 2-C-methyl-D-erythritol 4-phosphate cytidylyltransferase/2-C-methyl-D-erythritol 2,4-cyclodiphosphate synthase [Erythrobacter crassostrea]
MSDPSPPSNVFKAIIVAAGKGLRVGGDTPKQFRQWRGKLVLQHSIDALIDAGCSRIVLVAPAGMHEEALLAAGKNSRITAVDGGATRQQSVAAGLEALTANSSDYVLIHDAARPDIPDAVITRLLAALETHIGAIPVLPVVDSLAVCSEDNVMTGKADRESLKRVQTPQAFRFADILRAHRSWKGNPDAGDDAQVLSASGGSVVFVEGDERLKKITFAEDFGEPMTLPQFRVGQGYDVHRFQAGEELWLCGVKLEHKKGLAGHSDADVALHAITDAVFGAVGEGDIGTHFPPSDPQWSGARSAQFLEHAVKLASNAGYSLGNIDLTIICEAPKIGPHRPAMRARVAEITGLEEDAVSIKATTTERLGFTGREEGIAAQAIVGLVKSA